MNHDWLAQLAPPHAPAPPSGWPPAPGWWGVGLLTALLVAQGVRRARDPRRRQRRAALCELRAIRTRVLDPIATARAVEDLLRRFALARFGAERVARLSGERWLAFAAGVSGGQFSEPLGRTLLAAAFGAVVRGAGVGLREQWLAAAEAFVRRAGAGPERPRAAPR